MSNERPKRPSASSRRLQENKRYKRRVRLAGLVVCILLAFGILAVDLFTSRFSYVEGEIAADDLYYTGTTTTYTSELATEEQRNQAAAAVGQVFMVDAEIWDSFSAQLQGYRDLTAAYADGGHGVAALRAGLPGNYSDECLAYMLDLSGEEVRALFDLFISLVATPYADGVTVDDVDSVREELALAISTSSITGQAELFFKTMVEALTLPYNKAYDAVATRAAQDAAMDGVEPVQVKVQSGERLLSRGASISAEQIEALEQLGLLSTHHGWRPYLGLLLMLSLLMTLLFIYLRAFKRSIYDRPQLLLLVAALLLLFILLAKLISLVEFGSDMDSNMMICFLVPLPAASMLLSVLLDRNTAIISTCILSVCMGIIADGELIFAVVALVGGLAGVLAAAKLNQRAQFIEASLWVAAANTLVIISWGLIWSQSARIIGVSVIFGLVNGLLSAILAMGTMPFLESAFGVTTAIRLLELANSNNPLLKRLMMEAPGTYNHSILVGNLAEAAADAIGANTLLVRVASYYHDVGKLKRPQFFIENQQPEENPHDKLQPVLSAKIITAHPVDGSRMLRQAHLPQEVIDILEQHHGNSLLTYFHRKALAQADYPELVEEADFRYKGRRPQTREAGLVMLADSVQAAIQSLHAPSREAVAQKVHEVIQSKVNDEDQLRECPLTFRDLDQIEQSFLMVLSGLNHLRVSAPYEKQTPEDPIEKAISTHSLPATQEELPPDRKG